jgi:hydrogenase-4 component H
MSFVSKFREAMVCLKAGKATLPYPLKPAETPSRFRGRPVFNGEKCVGCVACANNCPAREILVFDICQEVRVIKYLGRRCNYCGRCAELCPEKAITMSGEFETGTNDIKDLEQELEVFMGTCQRCGRCYKTPNVLDELKMTGYRFDDLENGRWVYRSRSYLENDPAVRDIEIELD